MTMDDETRRMLIHQRQLFVKMIALTDEAERAAQTGDLDAYADAFEKMATAADIADFATGFHRLACDARDKRRAVAQTTGQATGEDAPQVAAIDTVDRGV